MVGYSIDLGQIAAAHHVALLVASGDWPGGETRLPTLLASIFAKSPFQQADLHQRLGLWQDQLFPQSSGIVKEMHPRPAIPRRPVEITSPSNKGASFLEELQRKTAHSYILHLAAAIVLVISLSLAVAYVWPTARWPSTTPSEVKQVPASRPVDRPSFPSQFSWPIAVVFALSMLPGATALAWWFAGLRRSYRWSQLAAQSPRDLAAIDILLSDTPIFENLKIELAARDLARHRRLSLDEIDLVRSVDETVRTAGIVKLVTRERLVTPQYVMLIEEVGPHDHVARLADIAIDRLRAAGVLTTRYYIASPSLTRDVSGAFVILDDLPFHHRHHRLLVIGPGEAVVDQYSGRLAPALVDENWADLGYLVVGEMDRNTARRLLSAGYAIAPATSDGIQRIARHMASASREAGLLSSVPGLAAGTRRKDLGHR